MANSIAANDLPDGLTNWFEQACDGKIVRLERHVARREAWIVDIETASGQTLQGFLRLQRETGGDPQRLERETRILQAIRRRGIPAPEIYAWSEEHRAVLMQRDPGRADIDKVDNTSQQRAVMEDFIKVVARFHKFDADELGLDDIMLYRPQTPRDCALQEVDELVTQWQFFLNDYCDPLLSYGLRWLERHAPLQVSRVSLLQGDTGPVNFMFQGDKVSAMIDWECGHYGDPLEDLGNIMVREFWNPSGGLEGLFKLYEQESGVEYERFRAQYYAVQQNVRGMIPIHYVAKNGSEQESLAWYLCYQYVGDRATAEMLAMAMNVDVERPELPDDTANEAFDEDLLARAATNIINKDVLPALNSEFAKSRGKDVIALLRCLERKTRFGAQIAADELNDMQQLLGHTNTQLADTQTEPIASQSNALDQAHKAVVAAIESDAFTDAQIIPVLVRKAIRDEWLYKPAVALYPDRRWSAID